MLITTDIDSPQAITQAMCVVVMFEKSVQLDINQQHESSITIIPF